jgi:hypothetical protein
MNPGGMSARDANATSIMPAMSMRVLRLPGLRCISQSVIFAAELYQQERKQREVDYTCLYR